MSNLILGILVLLLVLVVVLLLRSARGMEQQRERIAKLDTYLNDQSGHQELERQLGRTLDQSLGRLGQRIHESLARQSAETAQNLGTLREKLGVMDQAQQQFRDLGQHVVDLKNVLSNRQARGAIGELQLANLVQQVLPNVLYRFQATLSNNRRPDCLLILPNPPGSMVVDAKFPFEGYRVWLNTPEDGDHAEGLRQFSRDVRTHIDHI
ncbi:MAG: DNA recombination protein RmuC, partial [Alphaproteobacteria bacterium]|nr:DNA recombination protein RmuC [Alphaproteobacteria bacterium]